VRIILKPGGLALVGGAFSLLIGITVYGVKMRPETARIAQAAVNTGISTPVVSADGKAVSMPGSQPVLGLSPGDAKTNLLSDGKPWRYGAGREGAKSELTPITEPIPGADSGTKGFRFRILSTGDKPFYVLLKRDIPVALPEDKGYRLRFRAASPDSISLSAAVELGEKPFTKSLKQEIKLTKGWQEYSLPFRSIGYEKGGSTVTFFLGHEKGEIRLADVGIETFDGPIPTPTPLSAASSGKR
jgi:hypothetical protein